MEIYAGYIRALVLLHCLEQIFTMERSGNAQMAKAAHSAAKRSYHHGNLKSALVIAGIDILEVEGLPALSLRAIAARVGVSHTAPKNHFGSLRGLLTAIAAEGFRRHAAFMRAGVSEASGREDRLRAAMEGYVRFASQHKALFLLMFSAQHCEFSDPDLRTAAAASYAILADIANGLDWDKADAPGGQRRTEVMLWSLAHGYAQLSNAGLFGQNDSGAPCTSALFDISGVMPAFAYRPTLARAPAEVKDRPDAEAMEVPPGRI
jgi:AcrR family transcriptional regulator